MKKALVSFVLLSLVIVISVGCSEAPSTTGDVIAPTVTKILYKPATLCGNCGEIKGTESCCAEGAEVCAGCKLHKGAPGCCKIDVGTDVKLCAACGELKGTEACCAEGAEICEGCKLHKGAPGCCKLEKLADADSALEVDEKLDRDSEIEKSSEQQEAEPVARTDTAVLHLVKCGECEEGDDDHEESDKESFV